MYVHGYFSIKQKHFFFLFPNFQNRTRLRMRFNIIVLCIIDYSVTGVFLRDSSLIFFLTFLVKICSAGYQERFPRTYKSFKFISRSGKHRIYQKNSCIIKFFFFFFTVVILIYLKQKKNINKRKQLAQ